MSECRIEHIFDCSKDTYWDKIFFDTECNQALFQGRLHFERWELVLSEETPTGLRRALEAEPPLGNLPGPLRALLKKGTGYREEGELDRAASRYRFHVISHSIPDRLTTTGEVTVTEDGPNRCRRVYSVQIKAKIFGVGGMLEDRLISDLEKSINKGATFTQDWIAKHGLAGT